MTSVEPRWLGPEEVAKYVSVRVDHLPRLVRKGVLPKPSLHFGPRSPRWDRLAIDALFGETAASDSRAKIEAADAALRARLEARARRRRKDVGPPG